MKILVTGAAGFIGSHLCEKLITLNHEVYGIDNFNDYYSVELKEENAKQLEKIGVKIYRESIENTDLLKILTGCEMIFHFAAQPGISSTTSFEKYFTNNIIATRALLDAIMKSEYKPYFVNIATSSIYGKFATESEEIPAQPTSDYGVTKLAAEQLVLSFQREGKVKATSFRLYSVFGPRERPEKLYPKLIYSIINKKPFPLFEGSREHSRSFTYVSDIVDGLIKVLKYQKECDGEIFNIGSDIEITTGQAIDMIEDLLGEKAIIDIKPKRPGDQARTYANIEKAKRILGYQPKVHPNEGFKKEISWLKEILNKNIKIY